MLSFRSTRVQVVIVAGLCFLTARFGWFLASERHGISPFWPPTGVGLALLLLWGRSRWPSVLLGTLAAHIVSGDVSPLTVTSATATTLEAYLGATIARSFTDFDPSLRRLNDVAVLLLAILIGSFVGSTLGAGAICAYGRAAWSEFKPMMITWWLGDGMGALLFTPLILTWAYWTPRPIARGTLLHALTLLAALLVAGYLTFTPESPHRGARTALEFLPFPIVIWAALRFDVRGASTASALLGLVSLVQYGFWAQQSTTPSGLLPTPVADTILLVQTSIAVILLTGLVTAAIHTERNDAMEALARNEARYRTLYNETPAMLHSIDAEGRIIGVSDYWLRLLGYTREEALGRRPSDFMTPESRKLAEDVNIPRFIAREDVHGLEYQFVRKDGTVLDVLLSAIGERDAAGRLLRSMTVLTDVTEQKRAEAERQQMSQNLHEARRLESLGLLAGGIAHDFNNLLTSMIGSANLARATLAGQAVTVHLDEIERAADRATALVRQMQAYAGQGRMQVRPLDLNAQVNEVLAEKRASTDATIMLESRLAEGLPAIDADVSQVRQVIGNLLDNAIEAIQSQGGGHIHLTTSLLHADRAYLSSSHLSPDLPAGAYVRLDVADTGGGMPPSIRARVFDPFFTTKFTGRGLGLPAVLGIVRGHLGAVWVTSEEGAGTTVRVLFPASAAMVTVPAPPQRVAAAPDWQPSGVVLVIDDEAAVRTVMRRMLGTCGLTALSAEDGEAGVSLFREHREEIAVVLLDLTMPGMDGENVYRRLREIDARVPIVLMTGFSLQEATARCAALGVEALLQKPFRIDELQEVLRRALRPTA